VLRASIVVAFAAAFLSVLAVPAGARPLAEAPPATFTDQGGDSGTAADITTVNVTNDDKGLYRLDVDFATPYGDTGVLFLYLDTDLNASTGNSFGADYLLVDNHAKHGFYLEKWVGSDWDDAPSEETVSVSVASDQKNMTVEFNKSDLGDTAGFNFVIYTIEGDGGDGHLDDAPSGTGSWQYKLQETFDLTLGAAKQIAVKAGGNWVLALSAIRSDTGNTVGSEATIACKGSSGSTKLAVTERAFISGGNNAGSVAVCAFKVPKALKHKVLHGTISISDKGQTVTKSFTTTVK
jgi:hypothetical protein